jgi:CRP-like cAMP-binding protein
MNPYANAPAKPASLPLEKEKDTSRWQRARFAQQPFFKGFNPQQTSLLTASALETKFEPGEVIFSEGSPANRFYLILEGEVVLESEMPDRRTIPVQTLGPGEDLGWSWLFPPYSFHLSARATAPTKTMFFHGTRLREHCAQDHQLGHQMMNLCTLWE